jgi:predicted nucleotide-binding protein (sugar kinase/HSP70/actin superfamily)
VLSQTSLPMDARTLDRVFGADHPRDIEDVWKHSYSASTSQKIWAAKFVARHPNLIGIEISNFKCGHDAPAYQLIQAILESAAKPHFAFRDLDENKPAASMRIRIETVDYYLRQIRRTHGFQIERSSRAPAVNESPQPSALSKSGSA